MGSEWNTLCANECPITEETPNASRAATYSLYSYFDLDILLFMCDTFVLAVTYTIHDLLSYLESFHFGYS
jgi:hypothetical protein